MFALVTDPNNFPAPAFTAILISRALNDSAILFASSTNFCSLCAFCF